MTDLGVRVVGAGVVEPDAEAAELDFEGPCCRGGGPVKTAPFR